MQLGEYRTSAVQMLSDRRQHMRRKRRKYRSHGNPMPPTWSDGGTATASRQPASGIGVMLEFGRHGPPQHRASTLGEALQDATWTLPAGDTRAHVARLTCLRDRIRKHRFAFVLPPLPSVFSLAATCTVCCPTPSSAIAYHVGRRLISVVTDVVRVSPRGLRPL